MCRASTLGRLLRLEEREPAGRAEEGAAQRSGRGMASAAALGGGWASRDSIRGEIQEAAGNPSSPCSPSPAQPVPPSPAQGGPAHLCQVLEGGEGVHALNHGLVVGCGEAGAGAAAAAKRVLVAARGRARRAALRVAGRRLPLWGAGSEKVAGQAGGRRVRPGTSSTPGP